MTVRSGEFVEEYIELLTGNSVPSQAVQPNGVDLSVEEVYKIQGTPRLTNDEYDKGNRVPLEAENGYYTLEEDTYVIKYGERISIPEDHIGLVLPRSRLMRCGLSVETAVWDAGYEGVGEGGLQVSREVEMEEGMRVAQMIFIETEELEETYDGSHQGEGL